MTRKYFFHTSIDQVKTVVVFASYLIIILSWLIPHVFESPLLLYRPQLLKLSSYFTLTMLCGVYLIQTLFFQFKNTVYILAEDQLIKRNPTKIKTINLSEITSFRYFNYCGVGIVKTQTQTMFLSLIINNLPELIASIECSLERTQRGSSFNKKEIDTFKFYAQIAGFHLNHSINIISPLFYIIIASLFMSAVTVFFIWNIPFPEILPAAIIWILCGFIFPAAGFLVATTIILCKVSTHIKKSGAVNPDYDTTSVYAYTALITSLVYLIAGIVFRNLSGS